MKVKELYGLGAIDRNGYRFEPEYSVISQVGAVHVYKSGTYVEEIKFQFQGEFPESEQIQKNIDTYCNQHNI